MKVNKLMIVAALMLFLITIPLLINNANAQDDSSEVSSKLDQIINNQKAIMEQISSMKQELSVVKIRVTQQQ
ncbi:MAG: hypothetical protein WCY36_04250 [Candidatus Omnitrophota bacterium]